MIDLNGPVKGYTVGYVPNVIQDGSGMTIPVQGNARLQVSVNAPSDTRNGSITYNPPTQAGPSKRCRLPDLPASVHAGSFEGYTSIGLGVRARLPFRVLTMEGPGSGSRLIVDVARYW